MNQILPEHRRGLIISGKEFHIPWQTSNLIAAMSSGLPPST